MQDANSTNFITVYTKTHDRLIITKKEIEALEQESRETVIMYPLQLLRKNKSGKWYFMNKTYWSIKLKKIFAILPIYDDNTIICLVVFLDQNIKSKLISNYSYITLLRREITYCIKAIMLYNRSIARIVETRAGIKQNPSYRTNYFIKKQDLVLIVDKIRFW